MTSKDLSIFNSLRPFSIGFDDMFDQFENMLGNGGMTMQSNYPPYNIRKTGKDNYAIEVALAGFNKDEVTLQCIEKLKQYFNIDRWQINQPIILQELAYELSIVDGVGAIVPPTQDNPKNLPVLITNKFSTADGYSGNIYDINYATKDGIVYPSLDPSIFELKYPNVDIEGRAIGDSTGNQL